MKVGDVSPWPAKVPFDPQQIRLAMSRRGTIAKAAKRGMLNQRTKAAAKIVGEMEERAAREADPLEQAATFLRLKGYKPVFNRAVVLGGGAVGFQIGRHVAADANGVLVFARAQGWGG